MAITYEIQGREQLVRELRALGGPALRKLARRITVDRLKPVLTQAQQLAPVKSGRLRASLGELATSTNGSATARVGTRRDFTYVNTSGDFLVSGRGKRHQRLFQKGFRKDQTTAQQYARGIHFGVDRSGRIRRAAGAVPFLEDPITQNADKIIEGVVTDLRTYVETTR